MKKDKKIIWDLLICISCMIILLKMFFFFGMEYRLKNIFKHIDYKKNISIFYELDLEQVKDLQLNEQIFYLYVGRKSCPYCVEFVNLLSELVRENNYEIYYLNSITSYENSSTELKEFRDKYEIEHVPDLMLFKGTEKIADLKDFIITGDAEEIIEFLNFYQF